MVSAPSNTLLNTFSDTYKDPSLNASRWAQLWDQDLVPWDRGIPNPALEDTLAAKQQPAVLLGGPLIEDESGVKRRKRVLVPGCGRGYDVILLASWGYDAWGLEIAPKAVEAAREWAAGHADDYPVRSPEIGRGNVVFLHGDFFKDDWREGVLQGVPFELIYDYTFFCALPPSMRPSWAARHAALLTPKDGRLICVEFPLEKPPVLRGPPFGVSEEAYVRHLGRPGEVLPYDADDNLLEEQLMPVADRGLIRIKRWRPERTHPVGDGKDMVSIWRHRLKKGVSP